MKTYYPFPGYEEEVNGATTTRRTTYSLAGQAVAVRVQVVGGSNTVYYLHSDHLGSTTALSSSAAGAARYDGALCNGGWRPDHAGHVQRRAGGAHQRRERG